MVTAALLLIVVVPVMGYLVASMENPVDRKRPSQRERLFYGVGCPLGFLGLMSGVIWLVWFVSMQRPDGFGLDFLLLYTITTFVLGGLVMAFTRPRNSR